jgi:hypothetical protein
MNRPRVHPKEVENVVRLPDDRRYEYFVKKIADWQNVWGLHGGSGWALAADDAGNQLIPFWPTAEFAQLCAQSEWEGYTPSPIALDIFMDKWLPGMMKDGRRLAVFPTPSGRGVAVEPTRLLLDLTSELEKLE